MTSTRTKTSPRAWAEAEDSTLRAAYERNQACHKRLSWILNRPRAEVRTRALELGLMQNKITASLYQMAAALVKAGVSMSLAAEELRISKAAVARGCRRYKVKACERKLTRSKATGRPKGPPKPEFDAALQMVSDGSSFLRAAKATGVQWNDLHSEAKRRGIKSRFPAPQKRAVAVEPKSDIV